MIQLEVNNGAFVETFDYTDGMTGGDLIKNFTEAHGFRTGPTSLFDPSQNSLIEDTQPIVDDRTYVLHTWILQKVDDQGNVEVNAFLP